MADSDPESADESGADRGGGEGEEGVGTPVDGDELPDRNDETVSSDDEAASTEELRARVEEKYDFDDFGPADMAEMTRAEWEAAFDPDTWITGEELLDRVEADLKQRVLDRDVFARVERFEDVLVAYTADEYAAVYPDGTVEGVGTVRRDVEPSVALCSMDSYDVPDVPAGPILPEPREIPESSDTLGNTLLQVVGGVQILAGLALLAAYALYLTGVLSRPGTTTRGINLVLLLVAGIGFILIGAFMLVVVANARLSDRFRSAEYRDRLRGVGLADGERPEFLADVEGVHLPERDRSEQLRGAAGESERSVEDGSPGRR